MVTVTQESWSLSQSTGSIGQIGRERRVVTRNLSNWVESGVGIQVRQVRAAPNGRSGHRRPIGPIGGRRERDHREKIIDEERRRREEGWNGRREGRRKTPPTLLRKETNLFGKRGRMRRDWDDLKERRVNEARKNYETGGRSEEKDFTWTDRGDSSLALPPSPLPLSTLKGRMTVLLSTHSILEGIYSVVLSFLSSFFDSFSLLDKYSWISSTFFPWDINERWKGTRWKKSMIPYND